MDDHPIHGRDEVDVEPTGPDDEGRLRAAAGMWPAWLVAAGAALVAGYFFATESVWPTTAESFYALIFAGVAAAALGYGVHEMRERTSPG